MSGDAPPTYRTESSEWVFTAVHCSILPDVQHVYMSEPRPIRTYAQDIYTGEGR